MNIHLGVYEFTIYCLMSPSLIVKGKTETRETKTEREEIINKIRYLTWELSDSNN
jgi:predicted alpha/beta superfamily hydrolase